MDKKLIAVTVANYVANNQVGAQDLPALIKTVYDAYVGLDAPASPAEPEPITKATAAQIRKSLASGSHLVSFIDGKPYRLLKRHLFANDMTPEAYREKFGLPAEYPMTAPEYSATRSQLALDRGLGRKSSDRSKPPAKKPK